MHRDVNTKFAEFLSSRHLRKGVLILSFWNEYDLRAMIDKRLTCSTGPSSNQISDDK